MVTSVADNLIFDPTPLALAFRVWGRGYKALALEAHTSIGTAHRVVTGASPGSQAARAIAGVLGVDLAECWVRRPQA